MEVINNMLEDDNTISMIIWAMLIILFTINICDTKVNMKGTYSKAICMMLFALGEIVSIAKFIQYASMNRYIKDAFSSILNTPEGMVLVIIGAMIISFVITIRILRNSVKY